MNLVNKLHDSFKTFAAQPAISQEGVVIFYALLYQRALKIAHYLTGKKINQACIAVEVDNPADHIAALLGVLFSGNYYISVTDENKPFLKDSALPIKLTITSAANYAQIDGINIYDLFEHNLEKAQLVTAIEEKQSMCAFFTSGSTGRAKVIVHSHENILQDTLRQIKDNQITTTDKLDLIFSLTFSASLACIYPALLTGAQLCVFNLKEQGLHQLASFWEKEAITFATLSVSSFQGVCKISPSLKHLNRMRFISISAEPVKDTTIDLFRDTLPSHTILQIAYATTETRTISQIKVYNDGREQNHLASIGMPVAEKGVLITDVHDKLLNTGETGQIIVRSEFIANSYLGLPEESASLFVVKDGLINYRTGDMGYLDKDGYLFYCGRYETENKINGVKINLGTIQQEVENIPGMLQAAVVINTVNKNQPRLVCFFQLVNDAIVITSDVIKNTIASKLPATHLPNFYIPLARLPLTHSGKVDRKALEQMDIDASLINIAISPVHNYEQAIIDIFKETLETDKAHADSDFFDLGGSSLTSLLCIAEIERRLHVTIPAFKLTEYQTPKKLSDLLLSLKSEQASLISVTELNGFLPQKRNLYILKHNLTADYQYFLTNPLTSRFNIILLYYDLYNSPKIDNAAQLIFNEMSVIVGKTKNAVVLGNSINGYMAHQLACVVPQISHCILIDTYNYFEYEKYTAKNSFKSRLMFLWWQTANIKDYGYALYWIKLLSEKIAQKKTSFDADKWAEFKNGINYITENLQYKQAINNCIYFRANRTKVCNKEHGYNWRKYVSGNFHLINLFSSHGTIVRENSTVIISYLSKILSGDDNISKR